MDELWICSKRIIITNITDDISFAKLEKVTYIGWHRPRDRKEQSNVDG